MNDSETASIPAEEGLLSEVIEALHEGLALFDEDGILVRHNRRFVSLNYLLADVITIGTSWDILLRTAHLRGVITETTRGRLERLERNMGHDGAADPPIEIETPNGRHFEVALRPTATGGFLLTERDLTERRRLQENEREADLMLRRVLEACPASVIMTRLDDGEVIYRSPAAIELLGLEKRSHKWFARREEQADFLTALLPSGRVDDMNIQALRPDGSEFPAFISARQIDYRGEAVIVSSIIDLSKELALRNALEEQREQIFQAEKLSALGELLAGVAHELNNPLSVVVGHALMMREEIDDPEIQRRIGKISDAAERCSRIVKSFLAMARHQPAQMEPTDIGETIDMAIEALELGTALFDARVTRDIAPGLPPIMGDMHQLAQVLINLIANADQAIRSSGIGDTIAIRACFNEAAGNVEILVEDNGPGVPADIRNRIFDPLFTTKSAGHGTGIGLAFAHRVVSAHSGQIRLLPARKGQRGAAFALAFPAHRAGRSREWVEAQPAPLPDNERILVVDDEPEVADLIREVLTRDGYAVDSASSGEIALSMLQRRPYTLVLSDINMPEMSGAAFLDRLAADLPELVTRIAFVTGDVMSAPTRAFLDRAGRPWLEKPITPSDLRALVQELMRKAHSQGERS